MDYSELAQKNGIEFREFMNGKHLRFIGGITVDHWPGSGKTWIIGTDRSWIVRDIQEIFDVANLKKFPENVKWFDKKKKVADAINNNYINIDFLCPLCQKNKYIKKSSLFGGV